jgi:hypothetical protein
MKVKILILVTATFHAIGALAICDQFDAFKGKSQEDLQKYYKVYDVVRKRVGAPNYVENTVDPESGISWCDAREKEYKCLTKHFGPTASPLRIDEGSPQSGTK